jgi:AcrR family transcriptional regulator
VVTVRPASTRLPAARRRRQLLEVALEVFADRGFHVASMNHVAEAAGVTKPVLYQHFRSKRDLYREVLTDVGQQLLDEISKATSAAASPREQVELGFGAYFRFVHRSPAAFRVLFGGGTRRDEEFAAQVAQVEAAVAQEIAALIDVEGLGPDDRTLLAHGLVGLAEGSSRAWMARAGHGEDPGADEQAVEHLARLITELAWRGLRGLRGAEAG